MGVHSGWDSFLLKYGGEVFLDEVFLDNFLIRYGSEIFLERRSIFIMVKTSLL
jgi:hypothetical protein